jgi:DNA excision repair protein ERCC-4
MHEKKPKVIADARESNSIKKALMELGCEVAEKQITPADYVLSEECAVERKGLSDFLKSVYDGRLFDQAERLAEAYEKAVLIVEGDLNTLEEISNPAVFFGSLAKVMAEHNISVVFTLNFEHTALFLCSLAKKVQEERQERLAAKHKPRTYTLSQRQLLAVESLPYVGPKRAEKMLTKLGSVRRVFQASDEELLSVEGFGKKTVQEIRNLLDTKYPGLE